jgi:hypothetical protein
MGVDDDVEWHRKSTLVRSDHIPHLAVARIQGAASHCFRSWPEAPKRVSPE